MEEYSICTRKIAFSSKAASHTSRKRVHDQVHDTFPDADSSSNGEIWDVTYGPLTIYTTAKGGLEEFKMKDIDPFGALKEIMGAQEAAYGISLDSVITHEKSNEYIFDILSKDDFKADSPLSSCDTESTKDGGECAVKSNELTYSDAGSKHAGQADASPIAEEHQETSNSTWSQSDMSDHTTWAGLPSLCDLQNTGLTYHRLEHVCDMLGVGITTFKKHLRHIGLPRWPYRHLTSMQRMRRSIEVTTSMTKAEKLKALKEIEISEGLYYPTPAIKKLRKHFVKNT